MSSLLVPPRVESEEILDNLESISHEVERSLRDLRRINRFLLGRRAYRRMLELLCGQRKRELVVLDLGTGTSDLLEELEADWRGIGIDFKLQHLVYGKKVGRGGILRAAADAFHLPFLDGSVDVVTSAHFFHHFSPQENISLIQESLRVARVGVAINDTRRHYAPLLLTLLLSALRLVGRITRSDAPASVRQGYTLEEARAVGKAAGASRVEVQKIFPFRFAILLWK